jgi:hypothetical protein
MRIKWINSGEYADLARPDALRAIRRGRALLAKEETPPAPKATKTEPTKPKPTKTEGS